MKMKHLSTDGWDEVPSLHTHRPFFCPTAHLGEDLKVDLADVELRVWDQALQRDALSLQDRLGRPFNEQSGCMWTEIKDACYWSQHESEKGARLGAGRGGGVSGGLGQAGRLTCTWGGKCGCWSGQHFQNKALPFPDICFRLLLGKLPILWKSPATGSSTLVTPTGAFCRKYPHKHFA